MAVHERWWAVVIRFIILNGRLLILNDVTRLPIPWNEGGADNRHQTHCQ